jgi:hypothetical protein
MKQLLEVLDFLNEKKIMRAHGAYRERRTGRQQADSRLTG